MGTILYLCRNRKNEDWNEWDQMDAHELLRFLLDGISMEEIDVSAPSIPEIIVLAASLIYLIIFTRTVVHSSLRSCSHSLHRRPSKRKRSGKDLDQ